MEWVSLKDGSGNDFAVRVGDIDSVYTLNGRISIVMKDDKRIVDVTGDTFASLMRKILNAENTY